MGRPGLKTLVETAAADRAVAFINNLTHTKGQRWAGKPFNLRPWQEQEIVRPLFGTLREDGLRQYRTCFVMLPRKNGKSELAAAIALYCLIGENEPGGEIYSAAADRDQASIVFNVAAQMVRNDPDLSAVCDIIDSQKRIVYKRTGSFYRAISSEAHSKHGYNASVVLYDEVHAAPSRELWDVLRTSMGARDQPLLFAITTAGCDKHSLERELFDYAVKVRDGIVPDDTFLPVLYYAPDDADWKEEKVWHNANPALADFRGIDEMRMLCKEAQEIPAAENTFRRLYLCQHTEQDSRWFSMDIWDRCRRDITPEELYGQRCFGGLDLASVGDVAAFVLYFPDSHAVLPYFWIPRENALQRSRRDGVPYDVWINQGIMEATDGNSIDDAFIRKRINELRQTYDIRHIARDRWNAARITTELMSDGFDVLDFGQGFASMNAPAKRLEKLILDGSLQHFGNQVLRWMASNVTIEQDAAGNIKPSKRRSTEKIDGIVGLVMAIGAADANVGNNHPEVLSI